MNITWLGQAGLLFETENMTVMIDPYFSNCCEKHNQKLKRIIPIDKRYTEINPDILILTHNHLDHSDPETIPYFGNENTNTKVILSENAHDFVKEMGGADNDYIVFKDGTEWTEDNVKFVGVKAYHSENTAFGVIIEAEGKNYYVTGDTLYNRNIFKVLPEDIYAVFLPINGVGNNMNMADAARFARDCGAKLAVPIHFGMFDNINPEDFIFENRVIPEVYKKIPI